MSPDTFWNKADFAEFDVCERDYVWQGCYGITELLSWKKCERDDEVLLSEEKIIADRNYVHFVVCDACCT